MTEPLADRLLDALGDPIARGAVRLLLERELSQTELIEELGVAQATVSRVVRVLRAAGLVAPRGAGRGAQLSVVAQPGTIALFLAADRLAEQLLEREDRAQRDRSRATRRVAVRPAKVEPGATREEGG